MERHCLWVGKEEKGEKGREYENGKSLFQSDVTTEMRHITEFLIVPQIYGKALV